MKAAIRTRRTRLLSTALALAAGAVLTGPIAEARIVRIEITSKESPALEGRTFGNVGTYEKLRGKAYGEVDPADPRNAVITDIQLAPRNANGKVTYSMDIFILKPVDLTKGNHRLFIDVNNRGLLRWDRMNNGSNLLTRSDRVRFLRVYLQWGLRGRGNWKAWWRAIAAATADKVVRNQRSGRPLF